MGAGIQGIRSVRWHVGVAAAAHDRVGGKRQGAVAAFTVGGGGAWLVLDMYLL